MGAITMEKVSRNRKGGERKDVRESKREGKGRGKGNEEISKVKKKTKYVPYFVFFSNQNK